MIGIRLMQPRDRESVLAMMRVFYASPAVLSDGSEAVFQADLDACLNPDCPAQGYLFEEGGRPVGYAMTVRSFSTEFGRRCLWIEDLYLDPAHRHQGAGSAFIQRMRREHPGWLIRLEVERENAKAVAAYRKNGMQELPYLEMILQA